MQIGSLLQKHKNLIILFNIFTVICNSETKFLFLIFSKSQFLPKLSSVSLFPGLMMGREKVFYWCRESFYARWEVVKPSSDCIGKTIFGWTREIKQKKDAEFAEEPNLHAHGCRWTKKSSRADTWQRRKADELNQRQLTAILADEWRCTSLTSIRSSFSLIDSTFINFDKKSNLPNVLD